VIAGWRLRVDMIKSGVIVLGVPPVWRTRPVILSTVCR
jgi:hypothetical protein